MANEFGTDNDSSQQRTVSEGVQQAIRVAIDLFMRSVAMQDYSFPSSFDSVERKFVHDYCRSIPGIETKSKGKGSQRQLTIRKKNGCDIDPCMLTLSRHSLTSINQLLHKFPLSQREKQELLPRQSRRPPLDSAREVNRLKGCLSCGVPQVPPHVQNTRCDRGPLPILLVKDSLLKSIRDNNVLIISGPTGCGKTTQVPQLILEDCSLRQEKCLLLCTQPRRLSAVSVAERVAAERGEVIGNIVGYQIRQESRGSPLTLLTYCTTEVLIRTLRNASFISSVTHVIVDEVHERDLLGDFLLLALHDIISSHSQIKVILMSASPDVNLFKKYFNGCTVFSIAGHVYPVQDVYLDSILLRHRYSSSEMEIESAKFRFEEKWKSNIENWIESFRDNRKFNHYDPLLDEELIGFPKLDTSVRIDADLAIQDIFQQSTKSSAAYAQLWHLISTHRIDVNYTHSHTGITPLIVTAARGYNSAVEQLLSAGADLLIVSSNGWNAAKWAEFYNQNSTVNLLRNYMTSRSIRESTFSYIIERSIGMKPEAYKILRQYFSAHGEDSTNIDLIVFLINAVINEYSQGGILVFLPSYDDVINVRNLLFSKFPKFTQSSRFQIILLHSQMFPSEHKNLFRILPQNQRKIVLATRIAESSITIQDVKFVIDSGRIKQKVYNPETEAQTVNDNWISKSSVEQRKGRAGRTSQGICFHLYIKEREQTFSAQDVPEMMRLPLESLCLHSRLLITNHKSSISHFLSRAPTPPPSKSLQAAISNLKVIDALDAWEDITELGVNLVDLPIEPRLAKMVLYSIVFKCLDPVLTIACSLVYSGPFCNSSNPRCFVSETQAKRQFSAETYSDHMALLRSFQAWQKARHEGFENEFCERNQISSATMELIVGHRANVLGHLRLSGFVKAKGGGDIRDMNSNSENWAVVKAALCAGLYPNLLFYNRKTLNLVSQTIPNVNIASDSVILRASPLQEAEISEWLSKLPSDWIMHEKITKNNGQNYMHCGTIVLPITLALVAGAARLPHDALNINATLEVGHGAESDSEGEKEFLQDSRAVIKIDPWITLKADPEIAVVVMQLRQKWHSLFLKKMRTPSKSSSEVDDQIVRILALVLFDEEQSLGLQYPTGIGQRPRPMSAEYFLLSPSCNSAPNINEDTVSSQLKRSQSVPSEEYVYRSNVFQPPTTTKYDNCLTNNNPPSPTNSSLRANIENILATPPPVYKSQFENVQPHQSFHRAIQRSYDAQTRMLAHVGCQYFLHVCDNFSEIDVSLTHQVWVTSTQNVVKFNRLFEEGATVYLLLKVPVNNCFCGVMRMASKGQHGSIPEWPVAYPSGIFRVEWIKRAMVPYSSVSLLKSDGVSIVQLDDGVLLDPGVGEALLKILSAASLRQNQVQKEYITMNSKDCSSKFDNDYSMQLSSKSWSSSSIDLSNDIFSSNSIWSQSDVWSNARGDQLGSSNFIFGSSKHF